MNKIVTIFITAALLFAAGVSNADFYDLGFVAKIENVAGSERDLLQVDDIFKLITNGAETLNYLIDFAPETTTDTEFHKAKLFLVGIIGQTPEDLKTYYEVRGTPSEPFDFLGYLQGAADGLNPFALLMTGEQNPDGSFPISLLDGAKYNLMNVEIPFTVPGDFPCGIYVAETFPPDPPVTVLFEIDGVQCPQALSYQIKAKEKFEKRIVFLKDAFDDLMGSVGAYYEVKKPKELYNITAVDFNPAAGEPVFLDIHWMGYEIKLAKKQRKDEKIKDIQLVQTKFGELFVDTKKPKRLLVPSFKNQESLVSEIPSPSDGDHYKCYDIKSSKDFKFPKKFPFVVADQFNPEGTLVEIKKPKSLCLPVEKTVDNEIFGINDLDTHLVCYDVKPIKENREDVFVNNQFGPLQLETKKIRQLCVTTEKILP
jgi:hypothetical protein